MAGMSGCRRAECESTCPPTDRSFASREGAERPARAAHPYPAAVADAQDAYQGLLEQGVDAGQIALAGESAGGGLAVATLLALRDADIPLPSCAFLMSPYADLTLSGDSIADREAVDRTLTPEGLRLRIPDYVAGADASDPLISPVFADLTGLPPLLIQVGSNEILLRATRSGWPSGPRWPK
jgi:acetyl esterase/lipase